MSSKLQRGGSLRHNKTSSIDPGDSQTKAEKHKHSVNNNRNTQNSQSSAQHSVNNNLNTLGSTEHIPNGGLNHKVNGHNDAPPTWAKNSSHDVSSPDSESHVISPVKGNLKKRSSGPSEVKDNQPPGGDAVRSLNNKLNKSVNNVTHTHKSLHNDTNTHRSIHNDTHTHKTTDNDTQDRGQRPKTSKVTSDRNKTQNSSNTEQTSDHKSGRGSDSNNKPGKKSQLTPGDPAVTSQREASHSSGSDVSDKKVTFREDQVESRPTVTFSDGGHLDSHSHPADEMNHRDTSGSRDRLNHVDSKDRLTVPEVNKSLESLAYSDHGGSREFQNSSGRKANGNVSGGGGAAASPERNGGGSVHSTGSNSMNTLTPGWRKVQGHQSPRGSLRDEVVSLDRWSSPGGGSVRVREDSEYEITGRKWTKKAGRQNFG